MTHSAMTKITKPRTTRTKAPITSTLVKQLAAAVLGISTAYLPATALARAGSPHRIIEAPVISVTPRTRTVTEKIPLRTCWDEEVRVVREGRHHASAPTVVGAILGGVTAGALGRNSRHQPVIATAGALLGAAVAHDSTHKRNARVDYVTREQCQVEYELRDKQIITGYRVGYEYDNAIYYTQTDTHPGPTIELRVAVEPVRNSF